MRLPNKCSQMKCRHETAMVPMEELLHAGLWAKCLYPLSHFILPLRWILQLRKLKLTAVR